MNLMDDPRLAQWQIAAEFGFADVRSFWRRSSAGRAKIRRKPAGITFPMG
jgi:hypothetical protein